MIPNLKTERIFIESRLGNNEDPKIWINGLEDLQIKLEIMGSTESAIRKGFLREQK
jgi:hypothetical protein